MTREEVQQAINDGRMIHIFDKRFNYYRTIQPYMYIIEVFDENGFEMHTRDVYPYTTYYFKYEDCTLDEEKVKEHNEFGNITITKRLKLPSWENIESLIKQKKSFGLNHSDRVLARIITKDSIYYFKLCKDIDLFTFQLKQTYIGEDLCEELTNRFPVSLGKATKTNYDKARRICVKLFKGEEV